MTTKARKALQATKPQRKDFESAEQFEEALGYWMQRQGRSLAMTSRSQERRRN